MATLIRAALPGLLLAVGACQSFAVDDGVPARIVAPTDASRAALQAAVDQALHTRVTLADSALTTSSVLTIERKIPRSIDGQDAYGRTMEPPIRFELHKSGADCLLVDTRDGSRLVLRDTECVAE